MRFRFGRFELDEDGGDLRRDGAPVAIQPKPLALLAHLIRERERVVSLDELYQLLWPDVAVTPSSLTRAVSVARSAIGDTGRGDVIKSVARRGYRFCADVVAIDARASTPAERSEPSREHFVGRDAALATLRAAWDAAAEGRGRIALVTGPPGIGKTRLSEEMVRELESRGARVLAARARDGEGVPALWVWAQVLRQLAALPEGAQGGRLESRSTRSEPKASEGHPIGESLAIAAGALAELAPELATGLPTPAPGCAERSPEQNRFLLFEAITGALLGLARERPVVLFLEDLQWAGSSSLQLLEHLAYETAGAPLLILATVRSEPRRREHPVERALSLLRQQRHVEEVTLRGFSRREVAQLVEHTLGRPAPADLSSELVARTEGVPLLLREALRLLAERGDLRQPESVRRWAVSLPSHALDLVQRPLERLSPPCASLLSAGAVIGREWTLPLAAAVAGIERDAALDLADEAAAAGVIEPAPDAAATWRFSHALFQEGVYGRLPAGARARLHAAAAEEIERRHASDRERVIAELAHHRHASLAVGDPGQAFAAAVQAAALAQRVFAFEQAATHHQQALDALEHAAPVDAARRLETLLQLGDALGLAGDRERRRSVFDRALADARAQERPLDLARAAIGFCDISEWAPDDEDAAARLREALDALPADAERERAQVLTRLGYLSARHYYARALPTAREAIELARRVGDPRVHQDAIYALHFLLAGPDHFEERRSLAAEAVESARSGVLTDATIIAVLDDASDRLLLGDPTGAREMRALADEFAGRSPLLGRRWHMRVYDSGVALLEGRVADSQRFSDEAATLGNRIQHPYARGIHRMQRVVLAHHRDDAAEVLRWYDPARTLRFGPQQWVGAVTARALAAVGRVDEARAGYEELLGAQGFDGIPRNIRWSRTVVEFAHLAADVGDDERAATLLEWLRPCAHHHGVLPMAIAYGGPISYAMARLAELLERRDEADAFYAEAIEACRHLEAKPMVARILVAHAALLARRGDKRAARACVAEAREIAEALEMAGVAKRAQEIAAAR